MPLSDTQKHDIRSAIYVYLNTPPLPDKSTQEKLDDLNSAILDGTWGLWYDFATVQRLLDSPECEPYRGSVQALMDIIGGVSVPPPPAPQGSPEPVPPTNSYPTPDTSGLQAQIDQLKAQIAALSSPGGALAGVVPVVGSGGDVGFQLQTGTVTHRIYGNPADHGLRLWFNYREPYVNGSSYSIPSLGQQYLFFEQDGAASLGYFKPETVAAGAYDKLGGKGLLFRCGGWNGLGQRDKNVSIYTGQVGRGLQLGVCRTDPNWPDRFDIEIDPDSDDPVSITVGGQKRRIKARADGSLYVE